MSEVTVSESDTHPSVEPFEIAIPEADVADLRERLAHTRWAPETPGEGWTRGVPTGALREIADHWATGFDWRAQEAKLNAHPQFVCEIDGQRLHFLHIRSTNERAVPLMLVHGWPGSVAEFLEVIPRLTEAFHLVIPSLPGYGFSTPLAGEGWSYARMADVCAGLMDRLGYSRYGVQGGDAGAFIAPAMARLAPERVLGVHVNAYVTFPSGADGELDGLQPAEYERLERMQNFMDDKSGYIKLQSTRPKTLMHALNDSPTGQLAWILEKFQEWTDVAAATPQEAVDIDHLLTDVSLYWFTQTAGSTANMYWEADHDPTTFAPKDKSPVPAAVLVSLTQDVAVRRLAERELNVTRWTEVERGGHFMAMENPDALADDVSAFFADLQR